MLRPAVHEIIGAFETSNLVALGERHWAREDSEFRLALIREPAFARAASHIVVEFANPLHQGLLDGFVNGQAAPANLSVIWRDTTQPGAWDSPVYEEFLAAVREVNLGLPPDRRMRVLAGDAPIDWNAAALPRDALEARDWFAASVIEREVLGKGRKALLVFGAGHLYRTRPGTVVDLLRAHPVARWFVIIPVDGLPDAGPALVRLAESPLGEAEANDLFEKGTKRVVFIEGKPTLVPAQVFDPGVRARDVADACLTFGPVPPEFVPAPVALYAGTEYGREVDRRRRLLHSYLSEMAGST